jgi:sigma-B regulation protein RsbU (phosphoserine phosphatase)
MPIIEATPNRLLAEGFAPPPDPRRPGRNPRPCLPASLYADGFVRAAAAVKPRGPVGGDFYRCDVRGRELRFIFGDACGRGAPAARQAAYVLDVANQTDSQQGPASIVGELNRALCSRNLAHSLVTLFYGAISRTRLTYCNAGHCWPIVVDGSSPRRLSTGGMPLGLFGDTAYHEESVTIDAGTTLVVFSDGLSEATRQRRQFGEARIVDLVCRRRQASATALVYSLMSAVYEFTNGRQYDDMAVLVVQCLDGNERRRRSWISPTATIQA